jgi:NAD-dependent histone deacetylase SIR2
MYKEDIQDPEELCGGPIKPNIVFFGEAMPNRFFEGRDLLRDDKLDLMIVIGTSLAVFPFATNVEYQEGIPKVLINLENTEHFYDFDKQEKYPERLFLKGKCDDVI